MANYTTLRKEYNTNATAYDNLPTVPYGKLEAQLFACALGDATGQTVLDLGGGTGLKARQALDAGAISVDVVDISAEMLSVGKDIENRLGRKQIRWYEADASESLGHLGLGQYDILMANWLFDHALSEEALEGMWQNIAAHLKPGGRFVGVRSGDPHAPALATGKYGILYKDIEDIPGGVKLRYVAYVDPPIEFEATLMELSYNGSTKLHEKYGLEDIQLEPYENVPCLRDDPQYWKLFLDNPSVVAVKARKRID
jgi:ubiquinone/menaquinone biosynthesis C-methylase UbiE